MAIIRWQPNHHRSQMQEWSRPMSALDLLSDEMNRMLDWSDWTFGGRTRGAARLATQGLQSVDHVPPIDVIEETGRFRVRVDLPGMKKEEIQVTLDGNTLSIQGERKTEVQKMEDGYSRTERYFGSFARSLMLPADVESEKVEASYKDGVLEVTIGKAESAQPKQIRIES